MEKILQRKTTKNIIKMTVYSRSPVQNFDNWWFWVRKTTALLNSIKEKGDIDKIYLYAKDLSEPKSEFLIKKREDAGIKHFPFSKFHDPNLLSVQIL